jgi:hypothetical protein
VNRGPHPSVVVGLSLLGAVLVFFLVVIVGLSAS